MSNKYYNAIEKIKIDEDFKEKLISNLENNIEIEEKVNINKGVVLMKLKKVIISIVSALMILAGSGVVYAAFGGTINGVPVLEWMGIKFSNNYEEYVENIENQAIEDENVKVTLESTVCDEGFTIVQFRVNLKDNVINAYNKKESNNEDLIKYLSFNDPIINEGDDKYTALGGSNYNLIIDGEEKWVRGKSAQSIKKISENEYLIYQMWFLDDSCLNGKKEFKITLNDIVLGIDENLIGVDGSFNVKVSKEKAQKNTTTFVPKSDTKLKYKTMEKSIETISITPLQNIIKIKNLYKDISLKELPNEIIDYVVYDQNNNKILSCTIDTESKITYEDGTVENCEPGDYSFSKQNFQHATYEDTEMIAIEQSNDIKEITIKAFERSSEEGASTLIMQYTIDLQTQEVKSEKMKNLNEDLGNTNNDINENDLFEGISGETSNNTTSEEFISELENASNIKYIEIEVKSLDEENYKKAKRVNDTTQIKNLISIIKNSKEYTNYQEEIGEGDYFEGGAIATIYLKSGKQLIVEAKDQVTQNNEGNYINMMKILDFDSNNEKIYIVKSDLQSYIEKLYN